MIDPTHNLDLLEDVGALSREREERCISRCRYLEVSYCGSHLRRARLSLFQLRVEMLMPFLHRGIQCMPMHAARGRGEGEHRIHRAQPKERKNEGKKKEEKE